MRALLCGTNQAVLVFILDLRILGNWVFYGSHWHPSVRKVVTIIHFRQCSYNDLRITIWNRDLKVLILVSAMLLTQDALLVYSTSSW